VGPLGQRGDHRNGSVVASPAAKAWLLLPRWLPPHGGGSPNHNKGNEGSRD
ncbi:MAG: hypothetical protein QOF09_1117, partial [Alphaproteobacteria bacterium]|nr:hypothetical protein [Alphaproteobacteria bacterium]